MGKKPDYSNLSIEEQIELVKENGYNIKYIKNPCLEAQLEAVKEDIRSIQYIKNPCLKVQIESINNCYIKWGLNYIKDYITNQEALEYWELKYLLLEE